VRKGVAEGCGHHHVSIKRRARWLATLAKNDRRVVSCGGDAAIGCLARWALAQRASSAVFPSVNHAIVASAKAVFPINDDEYESDRPNAQKFWQ
jgi:hypothetical protein